MFFFNFFKEVTSELDLFFLIDLLFNKFINTKVHNYFLKNKTIYVKNIKRMNKSLNYIINEEIKDFINESYVFSDDRFKFKVRLTNSIFYNYNSHSSDYDTDITESDIIVSWNVGFWLNDAGFENFMINIEGIEGTYVLQQFNLQSDELEQETRKDINEIKWTFNRPEATLVTNGSLYIKDLAFDFENKTCTVTF
jgi:hypothetical protein